MTDIIITTGPESCGKTTLASALGSYCNCPVLPEVAREYLDGKTGQDPHYRYQRADLLEIAGLHMEREQALLAAMPAKLVLDTDLLVILVWHLVRYPDSDASVLENPLVEAIATGNRTYLLCKPDLAWEPDPLRENPHDRDRLYSIFRDLLKRLGATCVEIEGQGDARLASAIRQAGRILQST